MQWPDPRWSQLRPGRQASEYRDHEAVLFYLSMLKHLELCTEWLWTGMAVETGSMLVFVIELYTKYSYLLRIFKTGNTLTLYMPVTMNDGWPIISRSGRCVYLLTVY